MLARSVWTFLLAALFLQASDEFFESRIRPVLAEKCYACHSDRVKTPMGNLRLDVRLPDAYPKDRLLKAISYTDLNLRMPPTGKLEDQVLADFQKWIGMGAPDPRASGTPSLSSTKGFNWPQARSYWAFQPLAAPNPGASIDRLLDAKRKSRNISAAPAASRQAWIRRVTFDLTGLPPAPSDIADFLNDNSPDADERVVNRLLDSPRYGERWARHWLDLVRFAETNGHEYDNDKLDAWRYRDYIIRAFNQDIPYNTLIREHLAGDLLPNPRLTPDGKQNESALGTGFLWFGEVLNSATDSLKTRADAVDNQIDVLSKTFLGLTVACARCHDHKFDPIPTADYYSLAGILHSTYVREAILDSPDHAKKIAASRAQIERLTSDFAVPRQDAGPLRPEDTLFEDFTQPGNWYVSGQAFDIRNGVASSLGPGARRLVGSLTSPTFRVPKIWLHVRLAGTKPVEKSKPSSYTPGKLRVTLVSDDHKSADLIPSGKSPGFEWRSARMTKEIGRLSYFEIVDRDREGFLAVDRIVFSDLEKPPPDAAPSSPLLVPLETPDIDIPESTWGMISKDENPANVRLHLRGNHKNLGDEVPRGFLKVLAPEGRPPTVSTPGSGRLELANWIANDAAPLAARVMANRVWQHHFGAGLVRSVDNFGKMGEPPAIPELLELLAQRFVASGWSVKQLHREILLSRVYRMSSNVDPAAAQADPRNDLLHHFPVRRLEVEAIRDSMLAVSGALDLTMFGPGVVPYVSNYQNGRGRPNSGPVDGAGRRSVYLQIRRNFVPTMFTVFDYPPPVSTIGARGSSTVPAQSLMMLNNDFVRLQARRWAENLEKAEANATPESRVSRMFLQAFGRPPQAWETKESLQFAAKLGWDDLCHVLFNSPEFLYVQ